MKPSKAAAIKLTVEALGVVALLTSLSAWNEFLLAYLIFNRTELMPLQRGRAVQSRAQSMTFMTIWPLLSRWKEPSRVYFGEARGRGVFDLELTVDAARALADHTVIDMPR